MLPAQLDMGFLDADHATRPTADAIRAYLPRIRPGGILAGHDVNWPTVKEALIECGIEYLTAPDNVWYYEVPVALTAAEGCR